MDKTIQSLKCGKRKGDQCQSPVEAIPKLGEGHGEDFLKETVYEKNWRGRRRN